METNELPEEVKRKIKKWIGDEEEWVFDSLTKASEFGYRLGLQSCEKQLKAKDEEKERIYKHFEGVIARHLGTIDSLTSENARLKKANDGWENADTIKDMNALIDSLTKEVKRLKEENNKLRWASLDPSETGSSSKLEPTK